MLIKRILLDCATNITIKYNVKKQHARKRSELDLVVTPLGPTRKKANFNFQKDKEGKFSFYKTYSKCS